MQVAEVIKSEFESEYPLLGEISEWLDKLNQKYVINTINWTKYSYKPAVAFSAGYSDRELYLKGYITEKYFKAEKTETNQMVCEDSCFEFFVSPEDDGIYYNIEFNGIGTCLMGSGTSRNDNVKADPGIVSRIRRLSSAGSRPFPEKEGINEWTITIAIPFEVFFHHKIKVFKGKSFRVNFYKCGDKLTVPHYVTWNPVKTERPDFHQPAYFGLLTFL